MADVATPSAIDMSMGPSTGDTTEKSQKTKPEKPDEPKYKEDLAKAEKEHAAAQEKLVLAPSPTPATRVPCSPLHV